MEAIGGFPDTGVNSGEHPGQVWGWKWWRVGHTGDIRGSVGVQLSEMGRLGSSSSCFDLKNKKQKPTRKQMGKWISQDIYRSFCSDYSFLWHIKEGV